VCRHGAPSQDIDGSSVAGGGAGSFLQRCFAAGALWAYRCRSTCGAVEQADSGRLPLPALQGGAADAASEMRPAILRATCHKRRAPSEGTRRLGLLSARLPLSVNRQCRCAACRIRKDSATRCLMLDMRPRPTGGVFVLRRGRRGGSTHAGLGRGEAAARTALCTGRLFHLRRICSLRAGCLIRAARLASIRTCEPLRNRRFCPPDYEPALSRSTFLRTFTPAFCRISIASSGRSNRNISMAGLPGCCLNA